MAASLTFDRETLHELLLAVPVHLVCFDEGLVCRYAAPAGDRFLGRKPAELQGRSLGDLFPQLGALPGAARDVLAAGSARRFEHVTLDERLPEQGQPWTLRLQRCEAKSPETGDVVATLLVLTCARCACAERCCPADDTAPTGEPSMKLLDEERVVEAWRGSPLLERVRTKLTVIRGFAQLLRRRSRQLPPNALAEIERIDQAAHELGELIERYEAAGQQSDAAVSVRGDARARERGRRSQEMKA